MTSCMRNSKRSCRHPSKWRMMVWSSRFKEYAMKKTILLLVFLFVTGAVRAATAPEINVTLRMSTDEYIEGEKIRAEMDLANGSPDTLVGGRADAPDRLFLELFRASDSAAVDRNSSVPFT